MVKSTMQKMKAGNIQISGVIFNRVTGWSHSTTISVITPKIQKLSQRKFSMQR